MAMSLASFGQEVRVPEGREVCLSDVFSSLRNATDGRVIRSLRLGARCIGQKDLKDLCETLTVLGTVSVLQLRIDRSARRCISSLTTLLKSPLFPLKMLYLDNSDLGDDVLENLLLSLRENATLTLLSLVQCDLGPLCGQHFAALLRHNRTLKSLNLSVNALTQMQPFFDVLKANNVTLTSLNLSAAMTEEEGLADLLESNACSLLELNVGNNYGLDRERIMQALAKGAHHIRSFLAPSCLLNDEHMAPGFDKLLLGKLTKLDVANNPIRAEYLIHLFEVLCDPAASLTYLDVRTPNQYHAEFKPALCKLISKNRVLRELYVREITSDVSRDYCNIWNAVNGNGSLVMFSFPRCHCEDCVVFILASPLVRNLQMHNRCAKLCICLFWMRRFRQSDLNQIAKPVVSLIVQHLRKTWHEIEVWKE